MEERKEETIEYFEAYAGTIGIKKRCRKVAYHGIKVGKFSIEECQDSKRLEEIKEISKQYVLEQMRETKRITLTLHHITERGIMTTWAPFGGKDKKLGVIYEA